MKSRTPLVHRFALGIAALLAVASAATAADHLDAPLVQLDGRVDINDVYVFPSQTATDSTVLVMTVNPGAGVLSGTTLHPGARYEFQFDTSLNSRTDLRLRASFGAPQTDGSQTVLIERMPTGQPSEVIASGTTGQEFTGTGVRGIVDIFDDPFFFDLDAFNGTNGRAFCDGNETDFFAGLNVSAIVLEVANSQINDGVFRVAGTTSRRGLQMDRMGLPAINTVFIPSNPFEPNEKALKDAFNATEPIGDRTIWRNEVKDNLSLFYTDDSLVDAIADILLPDLLAFDTNLPPGFEFLNGRDLLDDVIDVELALITNGALTTDCIDENDASFGTEFPYLAPSN